MKRVIDLLRLSAKLLLALVLVVMVTGFLTAKPGLLGGSFTTYRWLHTRLAPLLFVPLLYLHTTTGLWFLVSRSKRWNRPAVRRSVAALWLAVGAGVAALYFVEPSRATTAVPDAEPPADAADAQVPPTGSALEATASPTDSVAQAPSGAGGTGSAPNADDPAGTDSSGGAPPPTARQANGNASAPSVPATTSSRPTSVATKPTPPASGPAAPSLDSNAVVQDKCTGCHGLQEVYAEKRTTAEWNEVIDRMVAHGADLSAAERAAVLRIMPRR